MTHQLFEMAIFQLQMSVTAVVVLLSRLVKYRVGCKEPFKYLLLYAGTETLAVNASAAAEGPNELVSCRVVSDRLCGLVVRVLGYRSGGPGSIPGTTKKKSSVSGTGSTQPREYN
jgi:hypothetical protein